MRVNSVCGVNNQSNKGIGFGHTFRVSICTKDAEGITSYVSPAKNARLYKKLNRKVVGFLNENFISGLRSVIGIPRKVVKNKTPNEQLLHKDIVQNLQNIDTDYRQASFVRSVYPKGALGYIATGVDAPLIEEFMGADGIGVAKKMAKESGLPVWETDARDVVKDFQKKAHDYVKDPAQLLRSADNNEIMLKVNFNEIKGKRGGKSRYEISDFSFQELKSKQLPPPTAETKFAKKGVSLEWLANRYIKHSFDKIYEKNKSKLTPQQVLIARNKFTSLISQHKDIKCDIPLN